jgi:hypothetical protein
MAFTHRVARRCSNNRTGNGAKWCAFRAPFLFISLETTEREIYQLFQVYYVKVRCKAVFNIRPACMS